METIDLPGIGPTKSIYVYAVGAGVVGVVGYAWWSRRNQAPLDEAPLYDPGLDQDSGGTTTPGLSTPPASEAPDPDTLPPTTNADWTRRATTLLTETFGYDGQMVALVFGKYFARQGLTPPEQDLVRAAWAQLGRPPEGDFPILPVPNPPPPPPGGGDPPPADTGPKYATVKAGWHVDQWIMDYRAHPESQNRSLTWEQLESWNPGIANNVNWKNPSSARTFKAAATYRVK